MASEAGSMAREETSRPRKEALCSGRRLLRRSKRSREPDEEAQRLWKRLRRGGLFAGQGKRTFVMEEERIRDAGTPFGWHGKPLCLAKKRPSVDLKRTGKPDEAASRAGQATQSNWRGTCADSKAEAELG